MFSFHKFLKSSETGLDKSPYFAESAPWSMAIELNRQLNNLGIHSELIMTQDKDKLPVYVKHFNDVYSSHGKQNYTEVGDYFKVINESIAVEHAIKNGEGEEDREEATLVISRSIERAIDKIVQEKSQENNKDSIEMKLLRAKAQGFDITKVMFHETEKENKESIESEGFHLKKTEARGSDESMPDGVFIKPTEDVINVAMEPTQIPVFIKKGKMKTFTDRNELETYLMTDLTYRELKYEIEEIDELYNERYKLLEKELRETLHDFGRKSDELESVRHRINNFLDDWRHKIRITASKARERSTELFKKENIDLIRVKKDEGSFGRVVDTTIVLNPDNIKSLRCSFEKETTHKNTEQKLLEQDRILDI